MGSKHHRQVLVVRSHRSYCRDARAGRGQIRRNRAAGGSPIKTDDLIGSALDYWVARADGHTVVASDGLWQVASEDGDRLMPLECFTPSTSWAQAKPITDREKLAVSQMTDTWLAGPNEA